MQILLGQSHSTRVETKTGEYLVIGMSQQHDKLYCKNSDGSGFKIVHKHEILNTKVEKQTLPSVGRVM